MMFRINLALWTTCAALSANLAVAQAMDPVETQALSAARFADMRGEYRMKDGSVLTVGGVRLRPVAWLDDREPVPLVVAGPNLLVSRDGRWRIEFRSHADAFEAVILSRQVPAR
jgi:hypothetical protein